MSNEKMHNNIMYSAIAYSCLALAGVGSMLLPKELTISTLNAQSPVGPGSVVKNDIMRDSDSDAPDFGSMPVEWIGQCTGILSSALGADGKPAF